METVPESDGVAPGQMQNDITEKHWKGPRFAFPRKRAKRSAERDLSPGRVWEVAARVAGREVGGGKERGKTELTARGTAPRARDGRKEPLEFTFFNATECGGYTATTPPFTIAL